MSVKLFIVFSFLLVHLTHGQNITIFGFQIPSFSFGGNSPPKANQTVLLDYESSAENDTVLDDTQQDDYQHQTVYPPSALVNTKPPSWNNLISSIDFNGLSGGLLQPTIDLNKLNLIFITRDHCNNVREHRLCKYTKTRYGVNDMKALLRDRNFDIDRKAVIYFHGFDDWTESEPTTLIIDAYLQRDDHNILICDYRELVVGTLLKHAIANIPVIAPVIARMIYKMSAKGFPMSQMHLVGHATGVQMAGSVGKAFSDLTEGSKLINRITGLDPAFGFFYPPIGRHITANDADFVDIIHTDAWSYGAPIATGSVDFWPNGGSSMQPGCSNNERKLFTKTDTCSHYRAVRFWAESLLTEKAFLAMKCSSWYKFKKNICNPKTLTHMGYEAKPGITGNYYLQTNGQEPFTRKHHGIIFDHTDDIHKLV